MMKDALEMPRPWWKEPMVWLVAGLPLTAVVASFATYFIAAHAPDPLVKAGYHKEGMAPGKDRTLEDRAAALGLGARLQLDASGRISLLLVAGAEAPTGNLRLSLIHPTHAEQDINVILAHTDANTYIGTVGNMVKARHQVIIEPEDLTWRLSGYWTDPLAEPLGLGVMSAQ